MLHRRLIIPCLLLLAACGSSPDSKFYALSASPGPKVEFRHGTERFTLSDVTIPGLLDRPQIVMKSSANEVQVLEYDRWAEPLDTAVTHVLAEDMVARGGVSIDGVSAHNRHIDVTIDEFAAMTSGKVMLKAHWTEKAYGENATPAEHTFARTIDAGGSDPDAAVAAMSKLLGNLAEAILTR